MSPPEALILDFGGVLTTDVRTSMRDAARRAGICPEVVQRTLTESTGRAGFAALERGEITQAEYEAHLGERFGVPSAGLLAQFCAGLRPDQAMCDTAAALRAAGVRVGVLSNSCGPGPFDLYAGWELAERFDAVVISHEVRMRKPEPEIFALALERLRVPADRSVFVDDVAAYLEPARAMGMRTIHHTDSAATVARLRELFARPGAPG